jgi:gliding motility-associated-like protein
MKKFLLLVPAFFLYTLSYAMHITGGEMYYMLTSQSAGNYTYHVTLKLYRDCFSTTPLDQTAGIAIFENNAARTMIWSNNSVTRTRATTLNLQSPGPCIQNPPPVCYEVGYYEFDVTVPGSPVGYTIAYQRCCRIGAINNLINSSTLGASYTAQIPGTSLLASAPANSSARFIGIDTVIVCQNNAFTYDFGAVDTDGDSLSYSFCESYTGGSQAVPAPIPPAAPPYTPVTYNSPAYSSGSPLGAGVRLNTSTGLVSGIAPAAGIYVVTVCVSEYRNGILIAVQRKDVQIKIGDCNVAQADPAVFDIGGIRVVPGVAGCKSFTYTFQNDKPANPLIRTYYWEFSDGTTYNIANPSHTFADTGVYTIKLVINRGEECSDSATTSIKIYPGFFPGFTYTGVCVNKNTQFFDTTRTVYGAVNSWRWDFGEAAVTDDTSHLKNPTYVYPSGGTKKVTFVVTNSVGCVDTLTKNIDILTRPPLTLSFKDTLICTGDSVQLHATGDGTFTWTPAANIVNANTPDPTVFPPSTTPYFVRLDYQGCIANDTVNINVVPFVSVVAMADTTICETDTLRLSAVTNGLKYLWSNPTTLNNPTLLQPTAHPVDRPTVYTLTSSIGHCSAKDSVTVTLVPYPVANAGKDTIICYRTQAQLNGTTDGSSFSWSPASTLSDAASLTPIAIPKGTTAYILTAFDTRGCPKPGRDTVLVVMNPEVFAFAGRDTAVVVGQTLQFNASGGVNYSWSPATALSNASIANPKGVYNGSFDSIRYALTVTDSIGCEDEATVLVKIFRTAPKIFVPTAFTPNGDGKNEYVAPIAVGITKLDYFRIFNRWGQLVFETTVNGRGWDGKISGQLQSTGTYVWIVRGTDFTGKVVFDKGTVTLIR